MEYKKGDTILINFVKSNKILFVGWTNKLYKNVYVITEYFYSVRWSYSDNSIQFNNTSLQLDVGLSGVEKCVTAPLH